jgi:putative tryptophan/tyrosine transport system substrate-binding protein
MDRTDAARSATGQQHALGLRGLWLNRDDPFFEHRGGELATMAERNCLPTILAFCQNVADGGLISYGPSVTDAYRLTGECAGRILKNASPAD